VRALTLRIRQRYMAIGIRRSGPRPSRRPGRAWRQNSGIGLPSGHSCQNGPGFAQAAKGPLVVLESHRGVGSPSSARLGGSWDRSYGIGRMQPGIGGPTGTMRPRSAGALIFSHGRAPDLHKLSAATARRGEMRQPCHQPVEPADCRGWRGTRRIKRSHQVNMTHICYLFRTFHLVMRGRTKCGNHTSLATN
jgi:hypothetical protein